MSISSRPKMRQQGLTLPLVAVMIVVLFLLAALAIDVGVAYTARTTAQHAADAAALAGAYTWQKRSDLTGQPRVDAAFRDGSAVANSYKVLGQQVNIDSSANSYSACLTADNIICVDEAKRRVTAVVAVPVETYFGKVFTSLLQVRVVANAEAAPNAAGEECIKPIFVSNDAISNVELEPTGPGKSATGEDYRAKCMKAYENNTVIFNENGELTDWAKSYIDAQADARNKIANPDVCTGQSGCPIEILTKETSPNPSQVGIVDFSAGQGNGAYDEALVACTMGGCLQECPGAKRMFQCSDESVGLKTGVTWGQLDDLAPLIDYARNKYIDLGNYENVYSSVTDTSHSIVTVVVWDCRQVLENGTTSEGQILGLAKIFMNSLEHKNTNAFLIDAAKCNVNGPVTGGGVVPIRLVNVNE